LYDRWRIVLSKGEDYTLYAQVANTTISDPNLVVPKDEWSQIIITDDGSTVSVYFNGNLLGTAPTTDSIFGKGADAYIRLGSMSYLGKPYDGMEGDVSQLKIYNKTLNQSEVSELYQEGPFSY
jgi:hypothetical protein